jgi:hypothetical protein
MWPHRKTLAAKALFYRSIFKKSRHFGLESISYFVHDVWPSLQILVPR